MMEESMTFYPRKKEVLSSKTLGGHIEKEYHVESDVTLPSGLRTIVLQEKDRKDILDKAKRLAKVVSEKVKGGKAFETLLFDTLRDYSGKDIDRMYKKVIMGEEPVSVSDRCFHILIGDGRKKGHDEIVIRE